MKGRALAFVMAAATLVAAGCNKGGGDLPAEAKAAPTKAPDFISPAKAAGGSGVAQIVGPAPPGSGFKSGPPVVGQKAGGGGG